MTTRQAYEYIGTQRQVRDERFRESAILLQGHAQQQASAIARMFDKKAKFIGLDKLYPDLFGKKKKVDTSHMSPEQIKLNHAFAWETFLGVK